MYDHLIESIKRDALPLRDAEDYDPLFDRIQKEKFVLLGESSHGTSEYYKIRSELSKRLIKEKGFQFIAVEGDWPACQQVNRYIKGYDSTYQHARQALATYSRWPTWMWANAELIELIEWLKSYNEKLPEQDKVGFYGIDVYSLWESMEETLHELERINSPVLETAKKAFACFEPFHRDPQAYGVSSEDCKEEVIKLLTEISTDKNNRSSNYEESQLNLDVNALITANAENYYRTMVTNDNESWNIRDEHMVEVIHKISGFYGDKAKGIIWAHNTHVGDARATDMADEGLINIGQVLREQEGENNIVLVGFGTHQGTVIAADEWGVNFETMITPPAQERSWEHYLHQAGTEDKLLLFHDKNRTNYLDKIGHRAIGVVYNPEYEQFGNYVPTEIGKRYDAFIYIDHTNALEPLNVNQIFI